MITFIILLLTISESLQIPPEKKLDKAFLKGLLHEYYHPAFNDNAADVTEEVKGMYRVALRTNKNTNDQDSTSNGNDETNDQNVDVVIGRQADRGGSHCSFANCKPVDRSGLSSSVETTTFFEYIDPNPFENYPEDNPINIARDSLRIDDIESESAEPLKSNAKNIIKTAFDKLVTAQDLSSSGKQLLRELTPKGYLKGTKAEIDRILKLFAEGPSSSGKQLPKELTPKNNAKSTNAETNDSIDKMFTLEDPSSSVLTPKINLNNTRAQIDRIIKMFAEGPSIPPSSGKQLQRELTPKGNAKSTNAVFNKIVDLFIPQDPSSSGKQLLRELSALRECFECKDSQESEERDCGCSRISTNVLRALTNPQKPLSDKNDDQNRDNTVIVIPADNGNVQSESLSEKLSVLRECFECKDSQESEERDCGCSRLDTSFLRSLTNPKNPVGNFNEQSQSLSDKLSALRECFECKDSQESEERDCGCSRLETNVLRSLSNPQSSVSKTNGDQNRDDVLIVISNDKSNEQSQSLSHKLSALRECFECKDSQESEERDCGCSRLETNVVRALSNSQKAAEENNDERNVQRERIEVVELRLGDKTVTPKDSDTEDRDEAQAVIRALLSNSDVEIITKPQPSKTKVSNDLPQLIRALLSNSNVRCGCGRTGGTCGGTCNKGGVCGCGRDRMGTSTQTEDRDGVQAIVRALLSNSNVDVKTREDKKRSTELGYLPESHFRNSDVRCGCGKGREGPPSQTEDRDDVQTVILIKQLINNFNVGVPASKDETRSTDLDYVRCGCGKGREGPPSQTEDRDVQAIIRALLSNSNVAVKTSEVKTKLQPIRCGCGRSEVQSQSKTKDSDQALSDVRCGCGKGREGPPSQTEDRDDVQATIRALLSNSNVEVKTENNTPSKTKELNDLSKLVRAVFSYVETNDRKDDISKLSVAEPSSAKGSVEDEFFKPVTGTLGKFTVVSV